MIYCKNCGTSMAESAAFCPQCGTKVTNSIQADMQTPINEPNVVNTQSPLYEASFKNQSASRL